MNPDRSIGIYDRPWRLVPNHIRGAGGREIDVFRGVDRADARDTDWGSEAWIGSVTRVANPPEGRPDHGCSQVALPDGRVVYLYQAIAEHPEGALGQRHMALHGEGLGMLIKYLDARRQYGLQCHPTRPWAKKMWGSDYGKEESWYVLGTRDDTERPAYIYLGFRAGATREEFERHYRAGNVRALEDMCHRIEVRPGDAFFVGGGCPHALGEGCFVIEVQEPSDITLGATPLSHWKPDASERERALHDERLLGAYLYDGCDAQENLRRWRAPRRLLRRGDWGEEHYVVGPEQTAYFSFTELAVRGQAELLRTGHPQVAIVIAGAGRLTFDGGEL
ncbi:MAG: hypothetical protein GX558_00025, partial [Clostridiales bacterium]|nr:hypothetical protein [Clostridiales bacterium]